MGICINRLRMGARVWTEGFWEHGHDKVTVPSPTGGTVTREWNEFLTIDNPLYQVEWDTGQVSVHYGPELMCIAQCRTREEFDQMIAAEAVHAKRVLGPNGGLRGCTIVLRSGDTIEGYSAPAMQKGDIPTETEILPRKPRRSARHQNSSELHPLPVKPIPPETGPRPTPDRLVTDQLLGAYYLAKNQATTWFGSLEQVAASHDAVLTPTQRECLARIAREFSGFVAALGRLEEDLRR
jgi:hypothetical protein